MLERLQKIIAHAGIASRRHAEQLILSGQVLVNGQVVRELGTKADPAVDKIEAAGRLVEESRKPVYLVLHKPPEVVSSLADPAGRRTLRNFLRGFPERVYPVGNLDYSASGLIFLTNDGDMTATILRSWSNIPQIYHIKIKGKLMLEQLEHLGTQTKTVIRVVRQPDSTRGHAANYWYEAQVTGAKLDELGQVLQKIGHPLEKVKRIGLGPLSLEGVPVGQYVVLNRSQAEEMRNPARPAKFIPQFKPKPLEKKVFRSAPSGASRHHSNTPGKPARFSKAFEKSSDRPTHYTKFQRRPSTPPNAPEDLDVFDDEQADVSDTPRAPWLSNNRPPARPQATFRPNRDSRSDAKPFRPRGKGPRNFSTSGRSDRPSIKSNRPSDRADRPNNPSGKFNRSGNSPNRFSRSGKSSRSFERPPSKGPGRPRPSSGSPRSTRNHSSRKPRPPR
jgi:23S rRNA pseudouridine2605 synthase